MKNLIVPEPDGLYTIPRKCNCHKAVTTHVVEFVCFHPHHHCITYNIYCQDCWQTIGERTLVEQQTVTSYYWLHNMFAYNDIVRDN